MAVEKWISFDNRVPKQTTPATPSTPRVGSSLGDTPRSDTPSTVVNSDRLDEFLRRENELEDQLSSQSVILQGQYALVASITEQLNALQANEKELSDVID